MTDGPPSEDFDYGDKLEDGQYENHPTTDEGESVQPVRKRYIHNDCGEVTRMGSELAESYARDPFQYGKTFCANCGDYYSVSEFVWKETGEPLDEIADGSDETYTAESVRLALDEMCSADPMERKQFSKSIEDFTRRIVEHGSFNPDGKIALDISLSPKERITGCRKQDVTGMFVAGMMIGAALERDVPGDSDLEDAWRDGQYVLPDIDEISEESENANKGESE